MDGPALRALLRDASALGIDLRVWASVPGFPKYRVSSRGEVQHVLKPYRYLRPAVSNLYFRVNLRACSGRYNRFVHSLVVLAFLDRSGSFL